MIIEQDSTWSVLIDGVATLEQAEVLDAFAALLGSASADGGRKRAAGQKVSWRVDLEHPAAIDSHLLKWRAGELVDGDSGAHPLVHCAWRALAVAWQEMDRAQRARDIDTAATFTTGAT